LPAGHLLRASRLARPVARRPLAEFVYQDRPVRDEGLRVGRHLPVGKFDRNVRAHLADGDFYPGHVFHPRRHALHRRLEPPRRPGQEDGLGVQGGQWKDQPRRDARQHTQDGAQGGRLGVPRRPECDLNGQRNSGFLPHVHDQRISRGPGAPADLARLALDTDARGVPGRRHGKPPPFGGQVNHLVHARRIADSGAGCQLKQEWPGKIWRLKSPVLSEKLPLPSS